ncbi:unnamed protein product [Vitrella brassicaformis CCMP3155]|uniref:Uncharacterized protein n=1 Tax=Vitrella brassicaformis (strain CCMP3155) TaxID=1169540 RepID=A0A0G4EQL8_VITBC|nr:unnamed protein product [Vitrella brassicaformis CCMP3155]|eukprot:CEL99931.1 unnamed protein product [Vitrella brassicaformis CCMP3155]
MHPFSTATAATAVFLLSALPAHAQVTDAPAAFEVCEEPNILQTLCDPTATTFSLNSTNVYFPLIPGTLNVLAGPEGPLPTINNTEAAAGGGGRMRVLLRRGSRRRLQDDDGDGREEIIQLERRVLNETEEVMGVETFIIETREYTDGTLTELKRGFYVEAADGTVCYMGEDATEYDDSGAVVVEDSWRAGEAGALPGIAMPAMPQKGDVFLEEFVPGESMYTGRVAFVEVEATIAGETITNQAIKIVEMDALEGCVEEEPKFYAPEIGLIMQDRLVLHDRS